jgi:hypothetical protein
MARGDNEVMELAMTGAWPSRGLGMTTTSLVTVKNRVECYTLSGFDDDDEPDKGGGKTPRR